jgi:hypothetical protein
VFTRDRGAGCNEVVRFSGVLDSASAREVGPFLADAGSASVTLDFSHARAVDYYGLSVLVAEMQARGGMTVLLRGLRADQIRMLRYFGVDPAKFGLDEIPCALLADAAAH